MTTAQTESAAIIRMALRSFGEARTALRRGRVDEMIGQLTRGSELLEMIGRYNPRPASGRRSARKG